MADIDNVIIKGGVHTNLIDQASGLSVNYKEVTQWYDGTAMGDAKCDGDLYTKKGSQYLRKVIDKDGELFLEKDTMADIRALTPREILYLKAGVYRGVKLNGYYAKDDTPAPIQYFISQTADADDGGSVIGVGGIKLEHVFKGDVYIEYYGCSTSSSNNGVIINKILTKYSNLTTLPSKKYLFNSSITKSSGSFTLKMGENTSFNSVAITTDGLTPTKIIDLNGLEEVFITGVFDGGYIVDGVQQGAPKLSQLRNALVSIKNSQSVYLQISVQNSASNWTNTLDSGLEGLLDYAIVYVRECGNVFCENSSLTTSRIEGFIFLGNDNVTIDNFRSENNVSIWTGLHLFLNNDVKVSRLYLDQIASPNGSTLNLYNNYTTVVNSTILGGQGIDHSWEITGIDISGFNVSPKNINISGSNFVNTSRMVYSLYHEDELPKENFVVSNNTYETTDTSTLPTPAGLIRIDACNNVTVSNNYVYSKVENASLFQSIGGIINLIVSENKGLVDNVVRLTQANAPIIYDYGNISVYNNNIESLPLNGRAVSTSASSLAYVTVSSVGKINDIRIFNNNITKVEGRAVQLTGNASNPIQKVSIKENNFYISGGDVTFYIALTKNINLIKNYSENPKIFSSLASVQGGRVIVNDNLEKSDTAKTNGMFGVISGTISYFEFTRNIFDVPNPLIYGIINNIANLTAVTSKKVVGNTPSPTSSKTLVANNVEGWNDSGVIASNTTKGLVNQSAYSADTATQASGANPTKAEFDALLAEFRDFKTKSRASGQSATS